MNWKKRRKNIKMKDIVYEFKIEATYNEEYLSISQVLDVKNGLQFEKENQNFTKKNIVKMLKQDMAVFN